MSDKVAELANSLIRIAVPLASRGTLITLGFVSALLICEKLAF